MPSDFDMPFSSSYYSNNSSTTTPQRKYDVFLTFRGEDTRAGFISHLRAELKRKQTITFIDNDDIKRGEEISPSLFKAIKESKVSLIVFSENYGSSEWCLNELVKILECRKQAQIAIPVFYQVDPSHVKHQTGSFGDAFTQFCKKKIDKEQGWKDALNKAANIAGWDSKESKSESEFVEKIVEGIWRRLQEIFPSKSVHGGKRAVICGVSYKNTKKELKRSINDAKCMKNLLATRFNFPESSIVMLTEEETDLHRRPTKRNMEWALKWLVKDCQPGDSLVFYFSGHGSQQKDQDGDELDGYDETLCPTDFETEGMIVDDEINAMIVRPLPRGVKLHAIIDSSHSGTVLDLPHVCRLDGWEDQSHLSGIRKGTSGGEVISFSGCDDNQTSAYTSGPTSVMTRSFIDAIEKGHATTYGDILNAMRSTIRVTPDNLINGRNMINGGAFKSMELKGVLKDAWRSTIHLGRIPRGFRDFIGRIKKEPQLTATHTFEVYSKPFSL